MKVTLIFLMIFIAHFSNGQDLDSLERKLDDATGTHRVDLLNQIAFKLIFNDQEKSLLCSNEAIQLASALEYTEGYISAIYTKGIVFDIRGKLDSSGHYFRMGYELSKENDLKILESRGLNNLGMMSWNAGKFEQALAYFIDALKLFESLGNESGISKAVSNIGLIYQELFQYEKALDFNFRSLQMRLEDGNLDHIARSYNNIGICFKNLNLPDSAIYYYQLGLDHAKRGNSLQVQSSILDNLANIFSIQGNFERAIENHLKSIALARDKEALGLLASYNNLNSLYNKIGNYRKGLVYGLKADSIVRSTNNLGHSQDTYQNLAVTYHHLENFVASKDYFLKWGSVKDSIFSAESAKSIAEMQEKYETEKKDQEIRLLRAETQLKDLEVAQTRNTLLFLVVLTILILLLGLLYFNRYKYKQKARVSEIRERNQALRFRAVVEAEEKERERIARELHDSLGQLLSTARLSVSGIGENQSVKSSLKVLDKAVDEVRNISHNMMPSALMNLGLTAAMREMIRSINSSGHISATLDSPNEFKEIPSFIKVGLYRTIQEIVNNALKYSEATDLKICMTAAGGSLEVTVSDNGKGFDTNVVNRSEGMGWKNIHTRMELMSGNIDISSEIGRGSTITLNIPLTDGKVEALAS